MMNTDSTRSRAVIGFTAKQQNDEMSNASDGIKKNKLRELKEK